MAGEGDAGTQSEDEILSEALETFDHGMGKAGAPGETTAAGSQGDEPGSTAASAGAGSQAGEGGDRSGAGGAGTASTAGGARAGSGTGATAGRSGSAGGGGHQTDIERVAELDRELDGQMGAFDGMLLEERAQILAAEQTGDDAGGEDDASGGGGAGEQDSGSGGEGDQGSGTGADGEVGAGGNEDGRGAPPLLTRGGTGGGGGMPNVKGGGDRQGDYEQVAMGGPVPQDIPSSDGDDVVARQLREAAMRETDPVLREKLWNEYRKYKGLPAKE